MFVPKSILLLSFLVVSVEAFGIQSPLIFRCVSTTTTTITAPVPFSTSTCLFSEDPAATSDEGNGETVESGEAASTAPEMDILNSPAFLKRKIEVLKSDIEATEKEAEEARALAEAGKAEWGPQLDALRAEVSHLFFLFRSF